jgi:hypothetical protein
MDDIAYKDYEDLDRVTAVVCHPTPSLVVKHVITLKRKVMQKTGNNRAREEQRGSVFYYFSNDIHGLYLECKGNIVLEGHRVKQSNDGMPNYKKLYCYIDLKDVSSFLNRLDIAYSWLTGDINKRIYLADSHGRPCKILDPDKKVIVSLSQSTFVGFAPCIIRDMSDVTYEGIVMNSEQGEISNFTASEFSAFRVQMHGLMSNLYLANSMLMNNAIQLSIYGKLKSLVEK